MDGITKDFRAGLLVKFKIQRFGCDGWLACLICLHNFPTFKRSSLLCSQERFDRNNSIPLSTSSRAPLTIEVISWIHFACLEFGLATKQYQDLIRRIVNYHSSAHIWDKTNDVNSHSPTAERNICTSRRHLAPKVFQKSLHPHFHQEWA